MQSPRKRDSYRIIKPDRIFPVGLLSCIKLSSVLQSELSDDVCKIRYDLLGLINLIDTV